MSSLAYFALLAAVTAVYLALLLGVTMIGSFEAAVLLALAFVLANQVMPDE